MGELIDFGQAREDREEAELLELQLRVEAALCGIGPVTSGPMWLDPVTEIWFCLLRSISQIYSVQLAAN